MSQFQNSSFIDSGYQRLKGFHSKRQVTGIRQKLLDEFKRLNSSPRGQGSANSLQKLPVFQQIGKLSALVKVPGLHEALSTPELIECITRLGGRPPSAIQDTQLLLSPPNQGTSTLENLNWHVDIAANPKGPLPGIQAFFLIDDVAPGGGATLALTRSHRVDTQGMPTSSRLREVLKTPGDLKRNLDQLGIEIIEMSGRAGDVFLMDMRVLHTPSVNSTKNVRMMATTRFFFDGPSR
ncbi:phytanoyl-CoA dioxygenase family protein [Variovorax sp. W6]|uniref:phytanoyl-CoA dioxygenase family protein n=1 Tax=Variovorax sp. W6 TaxID=3093895 RepID=UPI003D805F11